MTIFDEIAKGGNAQPIAAFLVGREQKRARERQQQIDELNAESTGVVNELRRAQTKAALIPNPVDSFVDLTPEQKKGLGIPIESFAQRNTRTGQIKIDDPPRTTPLVELNVGPDGKLTKSQVGKEELETRERLTAAYKVVDTAQSLVDIRANNRSAGGTAGNIIETVNEFAQAAISIAEVAGVDVDKSSRLLDPALYQDEFSKFRSTAIGSAEAQSAVVSLAFSAAAASSQTGRDVSDRDVARFIREIGGSIDDPKAFEKVIKSFVKRIGTSIKIRDKVAGRDDPRTAELLTEIDKFVNSGDSDEARLKELGY